MHITITYSFTSLIYSQKIIGRLAPKDQKEFKVVYISSSFWLLDQAEKEILVCKAEQIHKRITIFTQNDNLGPF